MEPFLVESDQLIQCLCHKIKEFDKNVIIQGYHKGPDLFLKVSRVSSEDFPVQFMPNVYTIVEKLHDAELVKVSIFSYNGEEVEYSCFPTDEETMEKIVSIYITSRLNSYQMCQGLSNSDKPLLDNILIEKYGNKIYYRSKDCARLLIGSKLCSKCEDLMIKSEFTEFGESSEVNNDEHVLQSLKEEVEENSDEDYAKVFETKEQPSMTEDNLYKDEFSNDMKFSMDTGVESEQQLANKVLGKKENRNYQKKSAYWASTEIQLKDLKCRYCEKTFSKPWNVIKHIQNTHEAHSVPCHVCGKMIKSKLYLDQHLKLVHGEKRFKCQVPGCESKFSSKNNLIDHVAAVHENNAAHTCSICGKRHKYRCARIRCENIHNGKFDHECDLCGKKFLNKQTYEGHLRSHSGEKPFACPICNIRMSMSRKIKEHIKIVHKMKWQEVELQTNTKISEMVS